MELKLKTKLLGGFGLVAAIALIIGIIGYYGLSVVQHNLEEVGLVRLPSIEYLLQTEIVLEEMMVAQRTLLSELIDERMRQNYLQQFNNSTNEYNEIWSSFMKLPATDEEVRLIRIFETEIRDWLELNEQWLQMTQRFEAIGILDPGELVESLQEFRGDLYALELDIAMLLLTGQEYTGITDAEQSGFYNWVANYRTNNRDLQQIINNTRQNYREIYNAIGLIQSALSENNHSEALKIFQDRLLNVSENVFADFYRAIEIAEEADTLRDEITELVIGPINTEAYETMDILDDLIEINEQIAQTAVEEGVSVADRMVFFAVITIIIGIIVALVLGWVISNIITKNILHIVDTMKKVAGGDFTVKTNIETSDELKLLGDNINATIFEVGSLINSIKQISNNVKSTTDGLSEQVRQIASSSEQTSSSVEETSATVEEFSNNLDNVGKSVESQASSVSQTTSSATEMAEAIHNISASADDMKKSVDSATSGIEQMISNIATISENIKEVDVKAKESGDVANESQVSVNKSSKGMLKIKESIEGLVTVINGLGKSAENIGNIVEVINDISAQTNLLSLNAAIEAARAGEHGKGFAVVADEVRKLAERSSKSTKEIAGIIKGIQGEIKSAVASTNEGANLAEEGVKLSEGVEDSLTGIVVIVKEIMNLVSQVSNAMNEQNEASSMVLKEVEKVNNLSQQVTSATKEQSSGVNEIVKAMDSINNITEQIKLAMAEQQSGSNQIATAMEEINKASQTNSTTSEEISAEAVQLSKIVQSLNSMINKFKVDSSNIASNNSGDTSIGIVRK